MADDLHRIWIYVHDDIYDALNARSKTCGVSISELVCRFVKNDIRLERSVEARAFFERLSPLESFNNINPERYVRELRSSRPLRSRGS